MKKLLLVLLAVLMLAGCGSKGSTFKVANAGDPIITVNGKTVYTYGDLVNQYQYSDSTNIIISDAMAKVADLEGLNLDTQINEELEYVKAIMGDNYQLYLEYNGYPDEETYVRTIKAVLALEELKSLYANENIETYAAELSPRLVQYAVFENKEDADAALARIKAGEQFDAVCLEVLGEQDSVEPFVCTEKITSVGTEVKEQLLKTEGLSAVVLIPEQVKTNGETSAVNKYYIFNLLDEDYNNFKADFVDEVATTIEDETVYAKYLNKHNFEVNNAEVYKNLEKNYPSILG